MTGPWVGPREATRDSRRPGPSHGQSKPVPRPRGLPEAEDSRQGPALVLAVPPLAQRSGRPHTWAAGCISHVLLAAEGQRQKQDTGVWAMVMSAGGSDLRAVNTGDCKGEAPPSQEARGLRGAYSFCCDKGRCIKGTSGSFEYMLVFIFRGFPVNFTLRTSKTPPQPPSSGAEG